MRILQVVHGFPPQEWAGTELVTLYLSQALRARGHEVTVLTRTYAANSSEGTVHESTVEGIPVARIVNNAAVSSTFQLSYDNPLINRPALHWLKQVQPDVVHIQHVHHLSISLLRLIPALGYPTVLHLHDFFFPCDRIQLLDAQQQLCAGPDRGERCVSCLQDRASAPEARRRFTDMERALHAPDVVLTPSHFLTDKIKGYFPFLAGRMRTIPHGVQAVPGTTRTRTARAPGSPLRVLYVGVLAPHKGAHVLIEALKGLPRGAVAVSLYGLEWSPWRTYAEQLQTNATELSVKFCGAYTHDQLGDILMRHDVLVMPMIWEETFSLVTREAFLSGLPVVAARCGALIEAVRDNVDGLHFEPGNPTDLRHCLERLLTEPGLLEQLRSAAPRVKTMAEYAGEVEAIYEDVRQQRLQRRIASPGVEGTPSSPLDHETAARIAPKVSVCIPAYNGATFLAEAITSVLAQSYPHFELLIVDDGSTDATMEIARSFADPRISIHQNEKRLGIPANWNRCLALAQGEYICIFHQDDVMLPENLARKAAILKANPAVSFVHSAIELLVEEGTLPPPANWVEEAREDFVIEGPVYFRQLIVKNRICAPTVLMRREYGHRVGAFDTTLGFTCDYAMWLKLCVEGQVAFLSCPLLLYRWHEKNATHAYRFEKGVTEMLTARQEAIRYHETRIGKQEEADLFRHTICALAEVERRAVAFDRESERRLVYIKELEQLRDKLWADVQRVGKSWEDQYAYIKDLEQIRDQLVAEREQRISQRLRRFVQKTTFHVR